MGDEGLSVHAGEGSGDGHPKRLGWRDAARFVLVSALLLVPCFWQSRIQAGDLSSHLYNAWLANLVSEGKAPGLWIEHRSNNVLFDVALQRLLQHVGPGPAQRILIPAVVLIFGWGALAFISAVAGRNWWFTLPCVGMLSYGFSYQIGFFNFYLSFGLCLWYLAIFWRSGWRIRLAAIPLLMLAWTAHPFPVLWAVGTAAYFAIVGSWRPRLRLIALGLGVGVLVAARYILMSHYWCRWSWMQSLFVTGADQLLIFGPRYLYIVAPLFVIAILLIIRLIRTCGWTKPALGITFQLWVVSAAAVVLIPSDVYFPTYAVAFGYIVNRLSLPAGIMACALLAQVPLRMYEKIAMILIVAGFSVLLYKDTRELNRWEDSIDARVAEIPAGQRVVSTLPLLSLPVDPLCHMVDRACVGHCYSYANYEPSTRQFRIRAAPGNGIVFSEYSDVQGIEGTAYIVQPRDLPLYLIYPCPPQRREACVRPLSAGDVVSRGLVNTSVTNPAREAPAPPPEPNPEWDNPKERKVAAEWVHHRFGGNIYGTVDEKYEGGPALVVHNRKATAEWAQRLFSQDMDSSTNEMLWQFGFRHYLVTNGTATWEIDVVEDPKYRSLFKDKPAPVSP